MEKVNLGFKKLSFSYENESDFKGKVYIEPLKRGFSSTIGNSLRRILLTSMPGVAVVGMEIDGINHEYQLIDGTIQDGVQIIAALKNMRFKMDKNEEVIYFEESKKGDYFAKDLKLPEGVECLTPDEHFVTLTGDKKIKIKLYLKKSVGYEDAEEHEFENENIIKIDGLYSPIKNVAISKEAVRVNHDMNYERLILDITTDGSILPQESVVVACKILTELLGFVDDMKEYVEEIDVIEQEKQRDKEVLEMKIEELGLTARSYNSLKNNGLNTVGDILQLTRKQLGHLKQVGEVSRREIEDKINELGYNLRQE